MFQIIPALSIVVLMSFYQNKNKSEEVDAITRVIIAEGEARQNHDFELFSECWAHETYILNYWAINWGCATINSWDELSAHFLESHQGKPDPDMKIRRENINIHINGNVAVSDFDLFIDNFNGQDLVSKANVTLEKLNGMWKIIYLNVIFNKSFNQ